MGSKTIWNTQNSRLMTLAGCCICFCLSRTLTFFVLFIFFKLGWFSSGDVMHLYIVPQPTRIHGWKERLHPQENNMYAMYGSIFCLGEVIKALRISMLDVSFKTLDSFSIPNTFFVWSFGACFIFCWWNVQKVVTVGGQQGGGLKHFSFSPPPGEMIQFD